MLPSGERRTCESISSIPPRLAGFSSSSWRRSVQIRLSETLKRLLIVYGAVFVFQQTIDQFMGGNIKGWFALVPNAVLHGHVWQILTYSFLHADVMHLLLNLLVLAFVGTDVESVWGRRKMLLYYFYCTTMAGLFYLMVQFLVSNPLYLSLPMMGASGGIYGLLLAYGILFPERELLLMMLFPLRAKQFVWVLAGIEFLQARAWGPDFFIFTFRPRAFRSPAVRLRGKSASRAT
ncbi:MAG: rhomboid family intramembrane serine protease [Proteobacteria bacterium]|nr:rhomboid family intramembrane serine protease [Pseudomonadota bacterium]